MAGGPRRGRQKTMPSSRGFSLASSEAEADLFVEVMEESRGGNVERLLHLLRYIGVSDASRRDLRMNEATFGETPLHCAATVRVGRALVEHGIPVDIRGSDGQTPLMTSVNRPTVIEFLLDCGAEVDIQAFDGSTALMWASISNAEASARLLLEHGASIGLRNLKGNTALHVVSSLEVAKLLMEYGADIDATNNDGLTPLETCVQRADEDAMIRVCSFLLELCHRASLRLAIDRDDSRAQPISVESRTNSEKIRGAIRKLDARERWRNIRQKVLSGSFPSVAEVSDDAGSNRIRLEKRQSPRQFSTQEFFLSFFELMIRDRPKLALNMLDKQRTFLYNRGSDRVYSYDTTLVGGLNSSNQALALIVRHQRHEIVSHEVVQWLLNVRWILFTREQLLFEFFLHVVFVALFFVTTLYGTNDLEETISLSRKGSFPRIAELLMELALFLMNLRYFARSVMEVRIRHRDLPLGISSQQSFSDMLPYACVLLEQTGRVISGDRVEILQATSFFAAVGAISLWIRMLEFAEGFEEVGLAMKTIRTMLSDTLIFLFVMFIFITGFSHGVALLFKGSRSPSYGGFSNTWITLFFFVFNLDITDLHNETSPFRRYFGYLLVGLYLVVVVLIILNLIVATMTNIFDEIITNSKEQWLLQRARLILVYDLREKSLNNLFDMIGRRPFPADPLPDLPLKNIVTEHVNGEVLIKVPSEWMHTVNLVRRQNRHYHRMRYMLFTSWKKLRRSPSFLWPSIEESSNFHSSQELIDEEEDEDELDVSRGSLQQLGDDLSVLDELPSAQQQQPLLHEGKKLSFRTFGETRRRQSSHGSTDDTTGLRTGMMMKEMLTIGRFFRNPKRIAAERLLEEEMDSVEPPTELELVQEKQLELGQKRKSFKVHASTLEGQVQREMNRTSATLPAVQESDDGTKDLLQQILAKLETIENRLNQPIS